MADDREAALDAEAGRTAPAAGLVVGVEDDGRRLVDVVRDRLVVVASREIGPLVGRGAVSVDGRPGAIADPVAAGNRLVLDPAALADLEARGRVTRPHHDDTVRVRHRDEHVVVVDKPHGMHVHPLGRHRDGTLVGCLLTMSGAAPGRPWGAWRPLPIHRLDRATSGLVLFATSRRAAEGLTTALSEGRVTRRYRAEVAGIVAEDGVVDLALGRDPTLDYRRAPVPVSRGGQPARTAYRVVAARGTTTVVELTLDTGRTHQVRAHLAAIGHPIVGDALYAADAVSRADATASIALRATWLCFPHPFTGDAIEVSADGPDEPTPR